MNYNQPKKIISKIITFLSKYEILLNIQNNKKKSTHQEIRKFFIVGKLLNKISDGHQRLKFTPKIKKNRLN